MIKQIIFPPGYSSFEQVIILDDRRFIIDLSWNSTYENWHMSLLNSIKEPIFQGKTLREDVELLEIHWSNPEAPQGYLAVLHSDTNNEKITFESFSDDNSQLFYNSDSVE